MNEKNIKIPLDLMKQTIYVLEHFAGFFEGRPDFCDRALRSDYENVLYAFYDKRDSLRLREAYAKIIFAKDEDSRHDARMGYLSDKRLIKGDF